MCLFGYPFLDIFLLGGKTSRASKNGETKIGEQKTWRGESEVEEIDEGASPALRIMGAQVTGGDWRSKKNPANTTSVVSNRNLRTSRGLFSGANCLF